MSAVEAGRISRDRVQTLIASLIHGAVHMDKRSYDELEALSGVPARAIKAYATEGKMPPLDVALSLAPALGKPAINAILSLIGYSAKPIADADEQSPGLIVAGMIGELQTIAQASADNRIDHTEAPAVDKAATNIIALASHFRRTA